MTSRLRRPRWLADSGRLTSDPRRALRLVSAEVAAKRLQAFIRLRGWDVALLERFQLVPSPDLGDTAAAPRHAAGATRALRTADPQRWSA